MLYNLNLALVSLLTGRVSARNVCVVAKVNRLHRFPLVIESIVLQYFN